MGMNQAVQQFYRLPQLKVLLGVSGSTIWSWTKQGLFPKPIKLSTNVTAWKASDVDAWAQARIEASQSQEVA
ncbi:AlpA family phage regulatory protein [Methylobacillus gramineus]|uniref:helix-turn-helix transcriptional regulator n=1 Tax=Methylobacillus gramineus TaxID=755169 RepID=UPI001CFFD86D|nr:AlpA family phage regulatory protein [Methylobacillus gramineus]MCB5184012.1 AlpA family phage regulatory protein [Methylobacillus gramineus]